MQYDPLSRHTVKITFTEDELKEYSLCSKNIALRTAETKRDLARLLKRTKLFSACKADRLFLEAFPRAEGGCVLYVSTLSGEDAARAAPPVRQELMCAVETLPLLIRLCAGLERLCAGACTRAYSVSGGYLLILSGSERETEPARRLMSEYGSVTADSVRIRAAAESGTLICGENAVSALAALY